MALRFRTPRSAALSLPLVLVLAGCGGKEVVRGANDPSVDAPALSTGLDKDDVQRALHETLNTTNPPPTVAIFPFQNNTSEHIDSMLDAMLGEAETWLVESGTVQVVARDRQNQMIREVEGQQNPVFNPANVAKYGKQLGVKYYITGKVSAADERSEDMRRVQYFLFMQVIDVETSAIRWQRKTYVTKAVK